VARSKALAPPADIARAILILRGHRVILDAELAGLYGPLGAKLQFEAI